MFVLGSESFAFMCSFLLFWRWVLYTLLIFWHFSLFAWVLFLSHFFSAALLLDFSWWAAWSNHGFILLFVTILLTSGVSTSKMDLIAYIYPLYNSCRLSDLLIVFSFAVRSILNLSRSILSRFLWVLAILSVGGLGKTILNLIMQCSDEKS